MMEIADSHINLKGAAYWNDLTQGTTGQYKSKTIHDLIQKHFRKNCRSLIDIGCGTCEAVLKYRDLLGATCVTCTDYDKGIVESMRKKEAHRGVEWRWADIFALKDLGTTYDLVFLLDMLHEVYSFYGRPDQNMQSEVDHVLGLEFLRKAFVQITSIVGEKGGIIITDDVLSEANVPLKVRVRTPEALEAVRFFFQDYPTKRIKHNLSGDILEIQARDLNIMLTQYNKIKRKDLGRWAIERMEIHEYLSPREYTSWFRDFGFTTHMIVGTPAEAAAEWDEDFEVLAGQEDLPPKRITLLAVRD